MDRRSAQATFPALPDRFARTDPGRMGLMWDKLLHDAGARARYTPALRCPCVVDPQDGGDGVPDVNCPGCAKHPGRLYEASQTFETRCVISSLVQDPQIVRAEGILNLGSVRLTLAAKIAPNYWDRVNFPDAVMTVQEGRRLLKPDEGIALRFEATELRAAYTRDPVTRAVVALRVGSDVRLDPAANTVQIGRSAPGYHAGMSVSLTYSGTPPFYVIDIPHEYRGRFIRRGEATEQWLKLPTYAIARRGDMISA